AQRAGSDALSTRSTDRGAPLHEQARPSPTPCAPTDYRAPSVAPPPLREARTFSDICATIPLAQYEGDPVRPTGETPKQEVQPWPQPAHRIAKCSYWGMMRS